MAIGRALKLVLIAVILGALLLPAHGAAQSTPVLKTPTDVKSYALGVEIARSWKRQNVDVDADLVIRGIRDVLSGNRLLMNDADLQTSLNMFTAEIRRRQAEARLTAQQDNKKKGDAFLAENKTKEGVVTLPTGLQYRVIKEGKGEKPTDAATVECNYRGNHIDGTEFDSSDRKGGPEAFKVSEVIPGWREALKLMPLGSKWRIFVPSELAYGQRGAGHIGPYETVIYEIELVAIQYPK